MVRLCSSLSLSRSFAVFCLFRCRWHPLFIFASAVHFLSRSFAFSLVHSLSSLHLFSQFRLCLESLQLTSSLLGRLVIVQLLRCSCLTLALPGHASLSSFFFALLLHGRVEILGGLAREADFSLALYILHFVPIRSSP